MLMMLCSSFSNSNTRVVTPAAILAPARRPARWRPPRLGYPSPVPNPLARPLHMAAPSPSPRRARPQPPGAVPSPGVPPLRAPYGAASARSQVWPGAAPCAALARQPPLAHVPYPVRAAPARPGPLRAAPSLLGRGLGA
jgi:hypothetical protein